MAAAHISEKLRIAASKYSQEGAYWQEALASLSSPAEFPPDRPEVAVQPPFSQEVRVLPESLSRRLIALAKGNDAALHIVLGAAVAALLHKVHGGTDLLTLTPLYKQNTEAELVNTVLPIRFRPQTGCSFRDLLGQSKKAVSEAAKHYRYPVEVMAENWAEGDRLADVAFLLSNLHDVAYLDRAPSALQFLFSRRGESLELSLRYQKDRYLPQTIADIIRRFSLFAETCATDISRPLAKISLCDPQERQTILETWNQTQRPYDRELGIGRYFQQQAETHPDKIALSYGTSTLSYMQLHQQAAGLAEHLVELGLRPGQTAALLCRRKDQLVIAQLAILYAGAAYLPIAEHYPLSRQTFMLEDAGASFILSDQWENLAQELGPHCTRVDLNTRRLSQTFQPEKCEPQHPAYIMYTSGSSGTPKGVLIPHAGVTRLVINNTFAKLDSQTRILQTGSPVFDATTFEVWGALLNGGRLVLADQEQLVDAANLGPLLRDEKINTLWLTVALFNQLVSEDVDIFAPLQQLLVGGDALSPHHIQKVRDRFPDLTVINGYGPTENTTFSACHTIVERDKGTLPIGRPIANSTCYIVDPAGNLQPPGIFGELLVGGDGLAWGYLNNPQLTADKFRPNPFGPGRLYHTGDRARFNKEGLIEFAGRMDQQVKIRGYRIEPGEIENKIKNHQAVLNAAVIVHIAGDGDKSLAAYVVPTNDKDLDAESLRAFLNENLPEYMVPAHIRLLDKLPLTSNGKLDRRALPEPLSGGGRGPAPRNTREQAIAAIWSELLQIPVENLGIDDNFFERGGHSLKAAGMVAQLHRELGVKLAMSEAFKAATIRQLAERIAAGESESYEAVPRAPKADFYPLSSAQKRIFITQQINPESTAYNIPLALVLPSGLEAAKLESAFRQVIAAHESFRTQFEMRDGEPVQIVADQVPFRLKQVQVADREALQQFIADFVKPFDLGQTPLLRAALVGAPDHAPVLVLDQHHIISDGVSSGLFTQAFQRALKGETLEAGPIQYKDFAVWQNSDRQQRRIADHKAFWLELLQNLPDPLELPNDHRRPAAGGFQGANLVRKLDGAMFDSLERFAGENQTTLFVLLLSTYGLLLQKLSGSDKVVVGSPIAGRDHADLEEVIGVFINTLAVPLESSGQQTFSEYLGKVRDAVAAIFDHAAYPFEDLVEALDLPRAVNRHPLFDTLFSMQNMDLGSGEQLGIKPFPVQIQHAKFDLTLTARPTDDGLFLDWGYARDLFEAETATRFADGFERLLTQILRQPETPIARLSLLGDKERADLVYGFNKNGGYYAREQRLHQLFESRVAPFARRWAVVDGESGYDYGELNRFANRIAAGLRERGIGRGDFVALDARPRKQLAAAVLGIWKAGAAYLPIDPEFPAKRIAYMVADSGARLMLTYRDQPLGDDVQTLFLDDADAFADYSAENPANLNGAKDPAYLIYTSGTTGRPKGVVLTHRNLVNYVHWIWELAGFDENCSSALTSSFAFDLGYTSFFVPLLRGGKVHLMDKSTYMDPERLLDLTVNRRISFLKMTPSLFATLADPKLGYAKSLDHLKTIFLGGEKIDPTAVERFHQAHPHIRFINHYGPTEATIGCIAYPLDLNNFDAYKARPVIGRPANNTAVYILDRDLQPAPIGVLGEMMIAGDGLAAGYHNRPELTEEKFIANPFENGRRLYRTGDLARWTKDGTIEFIGRRDHQVKIRGYRVELDEIKNAMLEIRDVEDAAVITDEQPRILAYYTGKALDRHGLEAELAKAIPPYMMPSVFVHLSEIPLTGNGKLDRKALPTPAAEQVENYQGPRTADEEKLVTVWREVLGFERIGIHDGFFNLGGDSIKAIQIATRLKRYGLKLDVRDLFTHGTIAEAATRLTAVTRTIDQGPVVGEVPLLPIQAAFFKAGYQEQHHYNHAVMLFSEVGFEADRVREAFQRICEHHDALRAVYRTDGSSVRQIFRDPAETVFQLEEHNLQGDDLGGQITALAETVQAGLNLEQGPLLRLALFHTSDGDHLLIVAHHLLVDGISWRVLLEDFQNLYQNGANATLPGKTDSLKTWAETLAHFADQGMSSKERAYWQRLVETAPAAPQGEGEATSHTPVIQTITLDPAVSHALSGSANRAYHTEINDLLLAGLTQAWSRWRGQDQLLIDLEGHGRESDAFDLDLGRTVGWFTSRFPVLLQNAENHEQRIRQTKENLHRIPRRGLGYGILTELADQPISRVQPAISFNYLGSFDEGSGAGQGSFGLSKFSSGRTISEQIKRPYLLDISGVKRGEQLQLSIAHYPGELSEEQAVSFAQHLQQALVQIAEHCAAVEHPRFSPADFGETELSLDEFDQLDQNNLQDLYPLSPMQEGMLFYALKGEPESDPYYERFTFQLEGKVDAAALETALNTIVQRYDILRTSFIYETLSRPTQVVQTRRPITVVTHDLRHLSEADKSRFIAKLEREDKERGFNLSQDPLMRFHLLQTDPEHHTLIWSKHHILMDGWCGGIIFGEVLAVYREAIGGAKAELGPVHQYKTYIRWLQNQSEQIGIDYWLEQLQGFDSSTGLPRLNVGKQREGYRAAEHHFELDKETTTALNQLAAQHQATFNSLFQTLWALVPAHYNHCRDVCFGAVVSGRPPEIEGIETMVGLMINTLPVRVGFEAGEGFSQILKRVQGSSVAGKPHEHVPLAEIQRRHPLKNNLFDHLLVFENYPVAEALSQNDGEGIFKVRDLKVLEQTNYPFNIIAASGETTRITFGYDANLYSAQSVADTAAHLQNIIRAVLADADIQPEQIDILTDSERETVLRRFNQTQTPYSSHQTLDGLFQAQVEASPQQPALYFRDQVLSYEAFNRKVNQWAHLLRAKGLKPGQPVAVLAERSMEMMVAVFAVIKAGGVYLPLSPDAPQDRIDFMLADSGAAFVLAQTAFLEKAGTVPALDLNSNVAADCPDQNPARLHQADDLAYIIYTSGSTGKPKGVLIEHHAAVNRLEWMQANDPITPEDRILQKTPTVFDVSIWELFWWSMEGAALVLAEPGAEKDPAQLVRTIQEHRISTMHFVPSMLSVFLEYLEDIDTGALNSLVKVYASGEALTPDQAKRFRRLLHQTNGTRLINLYGPTEATVDVSYYDCFAADNLDRIPIGKPVANTMLYILNPSLKPQPVGVPGELCIGGVQVARGYLNRESLTREKFLADPFNPGGKLYKTGDLARWLPDGNIEYLGRLDHQVKIRGYRIELGEIENRLLKHEAVRDVVVAARDQGSEKMLVAYIVAGEQADEQALRAHIGAELPDYMIPAVFLFLEQMPLTPNGKADRKALNQMPLPNSFGEGKSYTAPRDEAETRMAAIWSELLAVESVGIHDNFFQLGGDSIRAIRLINRIRGGFDREFAVADIYEAPTVAELCARLGQGDGGRRPALVEEVENEIAELTAKALAPGSYDFTVADAYPMSDISKGMIFYSLSRPGSGVYHDRLIYQFADPDFKPETLKTALRLLAEKHGILRTVFDLHNHGEPLQVELAEARVDYEHEDLSELSRQAQQETVARFLMEDAARGFQPMEIQWRYRSFGLGNHQFAAVLVCHHAILDGWSMAALNTELNNLMLALRQDPGFRPKPLANGYRAFVVDQLVESRNSETARYWREHLDGYKRLELNMNGQVPVARAQIRRHAFSLDAERFAALKQAAQHRGVETRTLSLAAYAAMLNMLSHEGEILFGLVTNNRPLCEDGDQMLGCFLNSVPCRLEFPAQMSRGDFLDLVTRNQLDIARHGRLSLYRILQLIGEKSGEDNPLFDTIFNYVDFHIYKQAERGENAQKVDPLEVDNIHTTNTLLDVTVNLTFGDYEVVFLYDDSRFSADDVARLGRYFQRALDLFSGDLEQPFRKIDLMDEGNRELWNMAGETPIPYPQDQCFHQLVESQAELSPKSDAVVDGAQRLTYADLNRRADVLAAKLADSARKTPFIGIMAGRSAKLITAVTAVLKAGAAWLPLDPAYPADRLAFMIQDSGVSRLLVDREAWLVFAKDRDVSGLDVYFLDDDQLFQGEPAAPVSVDPESPAYLIYTSGSTGKPKGVVVSHRAFVNTCWAWRQRYQLAENPVNLLQMSGFSFDVFALDLGRTLINGGCLVICDDAVRLDPPSLLALLEQGRINMLDATPPLLVPFMDWLHEQGRFPEDLRIIILGSDTLYVEDYRRLLQRFSDRCRIINCYGVTEAAIDSSNYEVEVSQLPAAGNTPIGKPIANTSFYIVDRNNQPQDIGIAGELLIAGEGLALGYHGREELTAERFHPLTLPDGRIRRVYRTGDLAKRLADGNTAFLGRIDFQVKIRGYRIELGEIEDQILGHEAVKDCAVTVHEDGGRKSLAAFYSADSAVTAEVLRAFLADRLPEYMVPTYFQQMEALPLTANGKIDRKGLPKVQQARVAEFRAPQNETQEILCKLWAELLGLEKVGIDEDFFQLGGDSIKAIQLFARLGRQGLQVQMQHLFSYPTIAELSDHVSGNTRIISQEAVQGEVPLTPVQTWFFEERGQGAHHYNHALMMHNAMGFDADILNQVLAALVNHHDALRLVFERCETGVRQFHRDPEDGCYELKLFDLRGIADPREQVRQAADNLQSTINLARGPLVRAALFRCDDGDHLLLCVHHLVVDGISWRIIMEDFAEAYRQKVEKRAISLPLKTDSFQSWAEHLRNYASDEKLLAELPFWQQTVAGESGRLPADHHIAAEDRRMANVEGLTLSLDARTSRRLLREVNRVYGSDINDLLIAGLVSALGRWAAIDAIRINQEGHGREALFEDVDISRTVGWFTSEFPVLLPVAQSNDPGEQVLAVKRTFREMPHKGIGYGILRYLTPADLGGGERLAFQPQVGFNYLGRFDDSQRAAGPLKVSALPSGTAMHPGFDPGADLNINGLLQGDELRFTIAFNRLQYERESIQTLADYFQAALERIADHGHDLAERGVTMDRARKRGDLPDKETYLVFNQEAERNLFCFPAALARGLTYIDWARHINRRFYAFDFIECNDPISRYADIISNLQPKGPVDMLAYSGGGKLAYAVAKELTARGRELGKIVLLDSEWKYQEGFDNERLRESSEGLLKGFTHLIGNDEDAYNAALDKMVAFGRFIFDYLVDGKINGEIHLIKSEETAANFAENSWASFSKKLYRGYQGSGLHHEMGLKGHIERNAALIDQALGGEKEGRS